MKAKKFYKLTGRNAARYAVNSGAFPNVQSWENAKSRDKDLSEREMELIAEEMRRHEEEIKKLIDFLNQKHAMN